MTYEACRASTYANGKLRWTVRRADGKFDIRCYRKDGPQLLFASEEAAARKAKQLDAEAAKS